MNRWCLRRLFEHHDCRRPNYEWKRERKKMEAEHEALNRANFCPSLRRRHVAMCLIPIAVHSHSHRNNNREAVTLLLSSIPVQHTIKKINPFHFCVGVAGKHELRQHGFYWVVGIVDYSEPASSASIHPSRARQNRKLKSLFPRRHWNAKHSFAPL